MPPATSSGRLAGGSPRLFALGLDGWSFYSKPTRIALLPEIMFRSDVRTARLPLRCGLLGIAPGFRSAGRCAREIGHTPLRLEAPPISLPAPLV